MWREIVVHFTGKTQEFTFRVTSATCIAPCRRLRVLIPCGMATSLILASLASKFRAGAGNDYLDHCFPKEKRQ
jgi:hypothetical protein